MIEPATGYIVAEQTKQTVTSSGLYIPPEAQLDAGRALVLHGGETRYVKGDTIIYKEYATTEIELDGTKYIIVAEDDVLGKVVEV